MSRLHFKGGPWTNAEDQVMKAALAQYGLRDWERVASMLTKKTAAQCRERWENYLDPRLNIREAWSLEEEEKLVELQSLFPNKFRLIAELLTRRTPTHYIRPAWLCEQRYLELKDERDHYAMQQRQQQGQGEGDEAAKQSLEAFMAERRRRRNARKTHEERAARADTVSGEHFQQEMVDMATSRLANQDQKKGLRKERQRQLEEAAFLAKLESNREGIESGTLSLRQSKKMRKALEEDRQSTDLVDMVDEDGDEGEDNDNDVGHTASDNSSNNDDSSHNREFEAIDMYEDQQQAGLVKKQRVLMKDLTVQQRMIQQRQILEGCENAAEGGDEGGSGSRSRATLTGVNHDLLKQLTAGPSSRATTTAALLHDRPSSPIDRAEAESELKSSLADLFASLPQATVAASTAGTGSGILTHPPPPSPPPLLKRPRDALPSISKDDDGPAVPSTAAAKPEGVQMASSTTPNSSDPGDVFGLLNLPAPRKYVKTEVGRQVTDRPKEEVRDDGPAAPSDLPLAPAADAPAPAMSRHHFDSFSTASEMNAYVDAARQWVAVECEKAVTVARHTRKGGEDDAVLVLPMSAAEREAAETLVANEMRSWKQAQEETAEAVEAVAAYVNELPHYTARVNVQKALHQLSTLVAAQVQEANAVLQPYRQEWEQILSAAMLDPRQLHVLQGYVRDDGRLKQPTAFGEDNEAKGASPTLSVAAYAYEHLVSELMHARLATRFLASLRDREQLSMRRGLDAAEYELQQLQAREKTLQDMYRLKRAQQ
ncbi:hypothetical protein ABL78_4324 [Leptomonas seymouri]|uniref:Uncharacterized protein n=1 Tax=Leptomonas seymouri TaxID=5684 RepID=A0A0N1IKC2_LEPSE|nr:hypothetical protein ABL78_4324 [Leptomonas seymouri]|eukprot:KPI86595.1 hypothetical protein ABL78_4324 [Leptomonas seymouri]